MRNNSKFAAAATIAALFLIFSISTSITSPVYADSQEPTWQLVISGLVDHNLTLLSAEIKDLPKTIVNMSLICVDFPNYVVAQGDWTGVSLSLLIDQAGVSPEAIKVAFYARDGYSTDLTLETARRSDVILAYERDGSPLPEAPRLVVPGKWGYKWISQISDIVLVNYDFKGKWESLGYSDEADITARPPRQSIIPKVPTVWLPPTPEIQEPLPPSNSSPSPIPTVSPAENSSDVSSAPSPISDIPKSDFTPFIIVIAPLALVTFVCLGLRKGLAKGFRLVNPRSSLYQSFCGSGS
jgi:hypothetical protein